MRYRDLGKTGLKVSELSFGCASLGQGYAGRKAPSRKDAIALLRKAYAAGINFFDVAPSYGNAEDILGEALGDTDAIFCTKIKYDDCVEDVLWESTDRLRREKVDVLLIHNSFMADAVRCNRNLDGDLEYAEFKYGHIGASVYSVHLDDFIRNEEVIQVAYNLTNTDDLRELIGILTTLDTGIIARQPYARGLLCNPPWNIGEQALRFCLSNKHVSTVLVGMQTEEELERNLEWASRGPLPLEPK